ncbi:MAG: CDP-glycerol glycerophosphotransferase family protein [Propionibacteriaceae bacterium]
MSRSEHAVATVLEVLLVVGALLAFVLAVSGTDQPTLARTAATLLVVVVVVGCGVRATRGGREPLGDSLLVRTVAAGAAAALFAGTPSAGTVPLAAVGALILIGGALFEPTLLRIQRQRVPFVSHLPGIPPLAPLPPWGRLALNGGLGATALGAVIGLGGAKPVWWLLLCCWAAFPAAALAYQGRQRLRRAARVGKAIPLAVARYAPEFIVHTARPDDASYQVTMWLPYLHRTGRKFIVATRDELPAELLADQVDVPVISCRRLGELEAVLVPSVKAVCYVNASSGNGSLVRYQNLHHVYLGHGDSDKPPSYNPTHAMYDTIFAAGPAAVRRYAEHGVAIPAEKFAVVGRPQVDQVSAATRNPADVGDPVVLYAPTWRGHVAETALSSLAAGELIVGGLLRRGATVIFRPHPFSYEFPEDAAVIRRVRDLLEADTRETGRAHLHGKPAETERGILDCLNASDAMICDVSSVVSDYLYSGKPFAMIAVPAVPEDFVVDYPVARAAYVVPADLSGFDQTLDAMLGADPKRAARLDVRSDYLGDVEVADYAGTFVDAVREVLDRPRPRDEAVAESDDGAPRIPRSRVRRLAVELAYELGTAGLALVGLTLALENVAGWLTGLPVVMALLVVGWRQRDLGRELPHATLATFVAARALSLLAAAAAVLLPAVLRTSVTPALVAAVVVGCVAGGAALLAEQRAQEAWRAPMVRAVGLPGLDLDIVERVPRRLLALSQTGSLLLTWLLVVATSVAGPVQLWAVPLVAQAVLAVLALATAFTHVARAAAAEHRLSTAVVELRPQFALYFGSGVGAAYQAGMWLPWLARIGRPWLAVARTVAMFEELVAVSRAQGVNLPVVHRPTLRSLEDVVVPSLRAAFYVNNAVKNTHFVERRELTHVWLNHGDSEKPACFNPVHAIYDKIFAAGQAGVDRYARHGVSIPAEKFVIAGRPQVAEISRARGPMPQEPTVLYAPTWQGPYADSRVFSLPQGPEIVTALLDRGATVVFRAHPFNYRFDDAVATIAAIGALLDADRARTGRAHRWGAPAESELSLEACFNLSDAMVSDVSATLSDYLMSSKPFAVVAMGTTPDALRETSPVAAAGYLVQDGLANLDDVLDRLLAPGTTDDLATERARLRTYYLGDFAADHYADGFLTAARAVLDADHRTRPHDDPHLPSSGSRS